MKTYIADVSEYQGPLDMAGIQEEGFGAVFIKAHGSARNDRGPFYRDPMFAQNVISASETKMVKGAYHYLHPDSPMAQAAMLWETMDVLGPWWAPIVDIEDDRLNHMHVDRFLATWAKLSDKRTIVIYTRRLFWRDTMGDLPLPPWVVLWDAHWVDTVIKHGDNTLYASQQAKYIDPFWWNGYAGKGMVDILQFTDHARVQGRWMDCSLFRDSPQKLAELLGVRI